jgi:predicted ester cyclase
LNRAFRAILAATIEANKNVARQWFDQVWNQKSEAAIDRLFHPQGKCYGFPEPESVLVGPEGFKTLHLNFSGAFPDLQMDVENLVAEGDHVAVRWEVSMTHTGNHLAFPASGRPVVLGGSSFIITNGKQILEGWNHMDLGSMFHKLQTP